MDTNKKDPLEKLLEKKQRLEQQIASLAFGTGK